MNAKGTLCPKKGKKEERKETGAGREGRKTRPSEMAQLLSAPHTGREV